MTKYAPFGATTYNLASSIGSTDTTIILSSFLEPVTSTPYTMALLNTDIVYATIAPKTTQAEFISFTGITQNANGTATLTGVTRGLAKKYPFTSDSTYKLPHSGQTQFIISDAPQVFNKYLTFENAETITGLKTFPGGGSANAPVSGTVYSAPTSDLEYASKKYVDNIAIAGAPDATTTTKGIVKISVAPVSASSPIAVGQNDPQFVNYFAETGAANAYVITPSPSIGAYATGQRFSFKATNANTTTSTLNINGLGAITIKKNSGTNLAANDILAGAIVSVEYDGTNFQMLSQIGNAVPIHTHQDNSNGGTLDAAAIATGTMATARLGSGSATSSTFLRGDQTWAAQAGLGAWTSATVDGAGHQVTTDGFIVWCVNRGTNTGSTETSSIYSDSASNPTTERARKQEGAGSGFTGIQTTLVCPIKKNDYYKLVLGSNSTTVFVFFIPLGN